VSSQQLGMNIDQILLIKGPTLTPWDSTFIPRERSFKEEVKGLANVKGVATTDRMLGNEMSRVFNVRRADGDPKINYTVRNFGTSNEFIDVYGIKLLEGRKFTPIDYDYNWQHLHNIIVNESAVKLLGFKSLKDAIGNRIMLWDKAWDIVGVIGDFHQKSLHFAIEPMVLLPTTSTYAPISVKINPQNVKETIQAIKGKYDAFFPGNLFDYVFLDARFNEQYKNDNLFGSVFSIFSAFAIFVACLGLLGLTLFATTQRTKEIGVRKVLGASVANIVVLISRDFLRLVLFAFLIASPIAWYVMHQWLKDFAYRINMSVWIFLFAGSLALIIALATISFQAVRAAMANPVKSLRTE
jgi:putative ABC transport system permease protein